MSSCVFCDIVNGAEPADRIYEDDQSLAFLDIEPAAPGHVLVVPTTHRETLSDMEEPLVAHVFRTVRRMAGAVRSACSPDGVTVVQSNGAAAGQEIPHAHVHVIPRYEDDEVTLQWPSTGSADDSRRSVAARLRREL